MGGVLRGEHVLLRAIERADVEQLHEWGNDAQTWGWTSDQPWVPRTAADALKEYDDGKRWRAGPQHVPFAVEAEGALAGDVSLWGIDELSRKGNLGIALGPHARGRGWGSDACRVLLHYAFVHRGLHRVQLDVLADNEAAVRAYRAAGFVPEGRRRDNAWVAGRFVDELGMSVLRPDWQGTAP